MANPNFANFTIFTEFHWFHDFRQISPILPVFACERDTTKRPRWKEPVIVPIGKCYLPAIWEISLLARSIDVLSTINRFRAANRRKSPWKGSDANTQNFAIYMRQPIHFISPTHHQSFTIFKFHILFIVIALKRRIWPQITHQSSPGISTVTIFCMNSDDIAPQQ